MSGMSNLPRYEPMKIYIQEKRCVLNDPQVPSDLRRIARLCQAIQSSFAMEAHDLTKFEGTTF